MLVTMTGEQLIRNMREAAAAFERANHTMAATVPLLREVNRVGLSDHERAVKQLEIERLRKQYKREMASVSAFYETLAHRGEELERKLRRARPG
jgi:hypothetical protein